MLKHIRRATEAEVERIRKGSGDLGSDPFAVYAMDNNSGEADIAVVKQVIEVDPIWFAKTSNNVTRARFVNLLEERLMGAGIERFGCRVDASDKHWIEIMKAWGYKQQSPGPELQMIRILS